MAHHPLRTGAARVTLPSHHSQRRAPRAIRHRAGLTLLELLLALSITSIVGLAVTAMLAATSYGTDSEHDMRALLVRHTAATARISAAVRSCKQILAQGDGYLILWQADPNANNKPDRTEIQHIECDDATDEILSYTTVFPDAWSQTQIDAADTEYELTDNFVTITAALKSGTYFPPERWAAGVTALDLALDQSDPLAANRVSYRITLQAGDLTDTAIGAAALRTRVE